MPSPPGEERAVADRVARYPPRPRARRRGGRRGRGRRLDHGQPALPAPADGRRRACRSSSARTSTRSRRRGRSSRSSRTASSATRPGRSSAPTTRRRSRRCSRRPRRSCARAAARRHRAPVHAEGGGRPARRGGVRPHAAARASGTSTTRRAPIGEVILGAPTRRSLHVRFHGRAAHAGMYPEEGRSAIAAAARAIADLRLGRLDEETTANVGVVEGGTARNIVPEWCTFAAEARSHDERKLADVVQEMLDAITFAAEPGRVRGRDPGRGELPRLPLPARRPAPCGSPRRRSGAAGSSRATRCTGGGADANVFNERGLPCVNLANGMARDPHRRRAHRGRRPRDGWSTSRSRSSTAPVSRGGRVTRPRPVRKLARSRRIRSHSRGLRSQPHP